MRRYARQLFSLAAGYGALDRRGPVLGSGDGEDGAGTLVVGPPSGSQLSVRRDDFDFQAVRILEEHRPVRWRADAIR